MLTWEWMLYGHTNDMHGDDLDDSRGEVTLTRTEAIDFVESLCDLHPGYEARITNKNDPYDFYDGLNTEGYDDYMNSEPYETDFEQASAWFASAGWGTDEDY